ncbi:hypothetical protein [Natrarchaeobius oligotrophus]|uniref:hypothetical protein n=1 Tax=Natrarchaeobius oligotrophus TaxID=3455743 RepID=UPI001A9D0F25|nr:hypothetical protein [Natrarchaeobius chitinivorans]
MSRPSWTSISIGSVVGFVNVAVVIALYASGGYPALESPTAVAALVATGFVLGFVAAFVSAFTRLVTPLVGLLAVLVGTAYAEVTTPRPEWSQLEGYVIVDGPTYVSSYANAWYVWFSVLLIVGVFEFAIRRGYGVGDRRLRNLPQLPLSGPALVAIVLGVASIVAAGTTLLVLRAGIRPPVASVGVFVVTIAVAAVPLAAVLTRGIVSPVVLFALVPYFLVVEVFAATDSPVHILLFGPYAIVLAIAWVLEGAARSRVRGWDGGRFAVGDGT